MMNNQINTLIICKKDDQTQLNKMNIEYIHYDEIEDIFAECRCWTR